MSERELDAVIAAIEERDRLRQELAAARALLRRLRYWAPMAPTDLAQAVDAALTAPESDQ